ncbi:MFS transporter [Alteromonas sp. C1M14]|uniref:MFS transporter n=1 Tax=Alteromonas sp. C1M14 TaxID=2841567 RepID=UPI001C0A2914|nr:MFS transporter [Alteromonas sp. C1M14]MBU2977766.1 MFS transporter [Alteromonas sp. C1M14]
MSRLRVIIAIAVSYFVFAILLNSVGTVILQSMESFGVSKPQASALEGFKDLTIAAMSFLVASFIPRAGYKLAMFMGLSMVLVVCLATPIIAEFWVIKVLFAVIGTAFALVKVSVYAIIGQLSNSTRSHSSLLNIVEGIFMLGVLSGYWLFSLFIDASNPASLAWLNVYYLLAALVLCAVLIVLSSPIAKPAQDARLASESNEFLAMLKLTYQPLVLIFILSVFLYVLIEQGIGTWLPTFNREVLGLPVNVSIQITSIFAVSLAVGRLCAGVLLRWIPWYLFLNICLVGMAILMMATLPLASEGAGAQVKSWLDAPVAAYMLPMIGMLMAPLYPVINSVMLSAVAKSQHAQMTGLIVVFSALGGTTGSVITGFVFEHFGGHRAFSLSLIPIVTLLITLFFFRRFSQQQTQLSTQGVTPHA